MGSGDPRLCGRARAGLSRPHAGYRGRPEGRMATEAKDPSVPGPALPSRKDGCKRLVLLSTARLNASRRLQHRGLSTASILHGGLTEGELISETASPLRCLQRYPFRAWLLRPCRWSTTGTQRPRPPGPLVLGQPSSISPAPAEDRDRTVSTF